MGSVLTLPPFHIFTIQIENKTNTDITSASLSNVLVFRPGMVSRDDLNDYHFREVFIASQQTVQRTIQGLQGDQFGMTLKFQNETVDSFKFYHYRGLFRHVLDFDHFEKSHDISYETSFLKLTITVENTKQQLLENERAEERNKEGEAAMDQGKNELAIKMFGEASSLANESATISSINRNMSKAYNKIGESCLQEAWDLEANNNEDLSQKASSKFNEAREMFQKAENSFGSLKYKFNLALVNLKIDGNQVFNETIELKKKAHQLFEEAKKNKSIDDYTAAQKQFEEVLVKYEEAREIFQKGSKFHSERFNPCVLIVDENIEGVQNVINNINAAKLSSNIQQLCVNKNKSENERNEEKTTKLVQQIQLN